jgi:hypothetical protein
MKSIVTLAASLAVLVFTPQCFGQVSVAMTQETLFPPAPTPAASSETEVWADDCSCAPERSGCRESMFLFGGTLTRGSMGDTTDITNVTYEKNYVIGLGYQRYPWSWGNLYLGGEIGVAGRFGERASGEIWAGPTLSYDLILANRLRITLGFTAGFSVVTNTIGIEREREISQPGRDATLLGYLGPEIAIATTAHPKIELFYRLHHRSGANETFGKMMEGANANVFGLRFRF